MWLYKTTKESFDRIESKYTQLDIDRQLLKTFKSLDQRGQAKAAIDEFAAYIVNKEKEAQSLKFNGKDFSPAYYFLCVKLEAIERIILKELGKKALGEIKALYEQEMIERILKSTEHR